MNKSILEVADEYGLELTKEGSILRAHCPFHSDNNKPNFTIYVETDSWFCFACSEGGDVISLVAKIEQISRSEARDKVVGKTIELEELQQKIDGVDSEPQVFSFNEELNVVVSHHCKKYLQKHSEQANNVLVFLKQFDNQLFGKIPHEQMQIILNDVKRRFPIQE